MKILPFNARLVSAKIFSQRLLGSGISRGALMPLEHSTTRKYWTITLLPYGRQILYAKLRRKFKFQDKLKTQHDSKFKSVVSVPFQTGIRTQSTYTKELNANHAMF